MDKRTGVPAAALIGHSGHVPARYLVGDRVEVLRACRLPKVEEVIGQGVVMNITGDYPNQLYWIEGFPLARDARQLRLVMRGGR
jgi:hypothetical protein